MAQGNRGVCGILPAGRLALFDACDKSLDRPSRSWVLAQKRGSNRRLRTFVVRVKQTQSRTARVVSAGQFYGTKPIPPVGPGVPKAKCAKQSQTWGNWGI
jgi:hypothetical protein